MTSLPDARNESEAAIFFRKNGYVVLDLPDPAFVGAKSQEIRGELRRITGQANLELERYHETQMPEERHEAVLIEITAWFRRNRVVQNVIERNLAPFLEIVGNDIKIERNPFIRLNRPQAGKDNLGYHRDTFYGASPFEMSCVVPFVDIPPEAALCVDPGSHKKPDSVYQIVDVPSRGDHVVRGSPIHKVGFPYAPRAVTEASVPGAVPVPLRIGQALVFTIACIHGSKMNTGSTTRVSSDCRIVNALAPVQRRILIDGRDTDYYEEASRLSPLTECALEWSGTKT